jgi:hypothetical protein
MNDSFGSMISNTHFKMILLLICFQDVDWVNFCLI